MPDLSTAPSTPSNIDVAPVPEDLPPRGPKVPVWFAVPVVVAIVGLGAYFVYRFAIKDADEVTIETVDVGFGRDGREFGVGGSVSRARGAILVHRPDFQIRATRGDGPNGYSVTLEYAADARKRWVKPAEWEMHLLAQRATSIPKFGNHIRLSGEQKQRLERLSAVVELTAADVKTLAPLIGDWDRAKDEVVRNQAATPLVDAAERVAAAHRERAKADLQRRVAEIPKVITPEQLKLAETYITSPAFTVN